MQLRLHRIPRSTMAPKNKTELLPSKDNLKESPTIE
uniref:Uncharacterized protein n=1 Tax=Parascaris equorum TaxID=6256 RepID=A0A914RYU2_PAREQ